jgi:hypothetical protein
MRDLGDKRVIGIRIGEQRADRQQHLGDGQRGAPAAFQDVEADVPSGADVGMIDLKRPPPPATNERIAVVCLTKDRSLW